MWKEGIFTCAEIKLTCVYLYLPVWKEGILTCVSTCTYLPESYLCAYMYLPGWKEGILTCVPTCTNLSESYLCAYLYLPVRLLPVPTGTYLFEYYLYLPIPTCDKS